MHAEPAACDRSTPEIPRILRSILPLSSHVDVAPGAVRVVDVRSRWAEFPDVVAISATSACFEVEEVSLRFWDRPCPRVVLYSRVRGDPTHPGLVQELLGRVVVPAHVDLTLVVRNVGNAPRPFVCGVIGHRSAVDYLGELSRDLAWQRRGDLDWWGDEHERLVNLSEEDAGRIDEALMRRADGSPRRDFRVVGAETS